ncbi:hypothetical protein E4U41_003218 [Claviceps citrina]|nr:hypothetical protein E4U41_003218 [Claviceps citrina]
MWERLDLTETAEEKTRRVRHHRHQLIITVVAMYTKRVALLVAAAAVQLGSAAPATSIETAASTPTCMCIDLYSPVCANGKTFSNACVARCNGLSNMTTGKCQPTGASFPALDCICPTLYLPVCGDGRTYGNSCLARCAKVNTIRAGHCPVGN